MITLLVSNNRDVDLYITKTCANPNFIKEINPLFQHKLLNFTIVLTSRNYDQNIFLYYINLWGLKKL